MSMILHSTARLERIVVMGAMAAALVACGGATEARVSWSGAYRLQSIDGQSGPWSDVVNGASCQSPFSVDSAVLTLGGGPADHNLAYRAYGHTIDGGAFACTPSTLIVEYTVFTTNGDQLLLSGGFSRFVGGLRTAEFLDMEAGAARNGAVYRFTKE